MTAQQVYLIRKTFAELSRHDHVAALVFYRRLFEIDPALRPLFTGGIEAQARKLMDMLGVLISMLERPVGLDMELRALGGRHAGYGVKDEHYATVGQAFLDMLSETLEKNFTPEVRAAWTALYGMVAAAMQVGAKEKEEALKITR
ncbi:globin domain-containing protein [Brevifollis gellanilyticus]|uniref:Hemoglobin n=1 Tax=Brevifollis gellanilyticus TaxID=748831 RepID=A0A512MBM6_9BACT|nr:globin domain-containing protein [Brevifollis gellanilyticus]GEP44133.1 hemoglobin [Brevifollis gellanilyticus]